MYQLLAPGLVIKFAMVLGACSTAFAGDGPLEIERLTIAEGDAEWDWTQARTAIAKLGTNSVFVTTLSRTAKRGAHGYHDVFAVFSDDDGESWSEPRPIPSLRRMKRDDGYEVVAGDLCPIWHPATGKVFERMLRTICNSNDFGDISAQCAQEQPENY